MKISAGIGRKNERGQTIALVAASLVALLGMAALSIDVVTLYVARGEAQRAADAAALGGARMFATTSFATSPSSFTASEICASAGPGSSSAVNVVAEKTAAENSVSNQPAAVSNISCDLTQDRNPRVTVTVKRDNLATFFSRMWSRANTSVSATATAEAYNASGENVAVEMTGVKPWLLPNCRSAGCATHYIDGSGMVEGGIGTTIRLDRINTAGAPAIPSPGPLPALVDFYALNFISTARACPAGISPSCNLGVNDYEDDVSCSNRTPVSCGPTTAVSVRTVGGYGTREGTRCLIHAFDDALAKGQDIFPPGGPPFTVQGGNNNPISSVRGTTNPLSHSDSIVTVPLYAGTSSLCIAANNCTLPISIVGFLQLGITHTIPGAGAGTPAVEAKVLDAVGCKPGATGGVSASGSSPVAVRLIHQ